MYMREISTKKRVACDDELHILCIHFDVIYTSATVIYKGNLPSILGILRYTTTG